MKTDNVNTRISVGGLGQGFPIPDDLGQLAQNVICDTPMLSNVRVRGGQAAVTATLPLLSSLTRLRELDMSGNTMGEETVRALAQQLSLLTELQVLRLGHAIIHAAGASALV